MKPIGSEMLVLAKAAHDAAEDRITPEYANAIARLGVFASLNAVNIDRAIQVEERLQKLLTEWRGRKKTIETVDVVQFLEHILHGKETHGVLSRMPGT